LELEEKLSNKVLLLEHPQINSLFNLNSSQQEFLTDQSQERKISNYEEKHKVNSSKRKLIEFSVDQKENEQKVKKLR